MYRIETHLHTTYISRCGWLGAEAIMKYYTACEIGRASCRERV